jgi:DNA-binding SARP family transcriptional activator
MRLMQALVAAEDPGNALLHARRHGELLRDELGVALPPELVALVERIRGARVEGESARATRPEEGKEPRKPKSIWSRYRTQRHLVRSYYRNSSGSSCGRPDRHQ